MKKVIYNFKMYNLFSSFLIFMPVLVNIYTVRGITTSQVLLIEGFYFITITLFELPTGYLGDRIGHEKLVTIGLFGTFTSYILLAYSNNIVMVMISQVLLGIFATCISGSDIGSLSTYLDAIGDGNNIEIHNSIYFFSTGSLLVAYLASGFVIKVNPNGKLIFIITATAHLVAIIYFVLFVFEKRRVIKELGVSIPSNEQLIQEDNNVSCKSEREDLIVDIIVCGMMFGMLSATYLISQIFYNNVNLNPSVLGGIYCIGSILSMLFARSKGKFNKNTLYCIPILFIIPMVNNKLIVIPFLILLSYTKAKINPFINNYIAYNSKENKALNLSISSLINNFINGALMCSLSGIIYKFGFTLAMGLFSIATIILITYIHKTSSDEFKKAITE